MRLSAILMRKMDIFILHSAMGTIDAHCGSAAGEGTLMLPARAPVIDTVCKDSVSLMSLENLTDDTIRKRLVAPLTSQEQSQPAGLFVDDLLLMQSLSLPSCDVNPSNLWAQGPWLLCHFLHN